MEVWVEKGRANVTGRSVEQADKLGGGGRLEGDLKVVPWRVCVSSWISSDRLSSRLFPLLCHNAVKEQQMGNQCWTGELDGS